MESFIWMFKKEDFKKHYLYLILIFIFSLIIFFLFVTFFGGTTKADIKLEITTTVLLTLPILLSHGYFWNLTENIIKRRSNINMNNIYDGKIHKTYEFDLPTLNPFKLIWRGFASSIASIFLVLPYALVLLISFLTGGFCRTPMPVIIASMVFFCMLIPPLLWLYAKENSVTAVLNIHKAISLISDYPGRYFKMVLTFLFVYIINFIPDNYMSQALTTDTNINPIFIIIYLIIFVLKSFYLIFVNAHILGTFLVEQEW